MKRPMTPPGRESEPTPAANRGLGPLADGLDQLTDEELAVRYEGLADELGRLEDQIGRLRPIFLVHAKKLAARLRARDPHGCAVLGDRFYRAHADGGGVRREKTVDPRWLASERRRLHG